MGRNRWRFSKSSVAVGVFGLAIGLLAANHSLTYGQSASHVTGVPDDWSHHRVIYSNPGTYDQVKNDPAAYSKWIKIQYDTRYILQQMKRNGTTAGGYSPQATTAIATQLTALKKKNPPPSPLKRDWSVSMVSTSATVGANNYPATYTYETSNPTTANCSGGTNPDFVVYNTGVAGGSGQASIIAYDNLYSVCAGNQPMVYWAYNTGGTISTSVAESVDGTQFAFIHSATTPSLVLLKWSATTGSFTGTTHATTSVTGVSSCTGLTTVGTPIYGSGIPQGDTIATACSGSSLTLAIAATNSVTETLTFSSATAAAPISPTSVANSAYKTCTAPCMTTINFTHSNNDTLSSPFYDFVNDNIYVGDGGGYLYGFTNVFKGTPAFGWATAVATQHVVASPVFDPVSGYVYTVDYSTNVDEVTTAGVIHAQVGINGTGGNNTDDIQEGPILDPSAGKVYMFGEGKSNNYVAQIQTNFTGSSPVTYVEVGTSANSNSDLLYAGNFDNAYYTSSLGTGNLYVCGDNGGAATLYQIPITSGAMSTTANPGPALTSSTQQCSPASEIYNASGAVPFDWLFVGVRGAGLATGCASGACVMGIPITSWLPSTSYAKGQMIVNNHFNIEVVTTAGTSGATQPTWPAAGTIGTATTDSGVTWTSQGPFTFTAFATGHAYTVNTVIVDNNNPPYLQRVTTAGTSGGSTPTWNDTSFGLTTTSGGVTFTNQGPLGISGSPSAGGTSGITMDNTGTNGGSNIYFSTLTTNGDAISASQSAP